MDNNDINKTQSMLTHEELKLKLKNQIKLKRNNKRKTKNSIKKEKEEKEEEEKEGETINKDDISNAMKNMSMDDIMNTFNKLKDEPAFSELLKKISN